MKNIDKTLTKKETDQIIRLLGKLQGFLESSIDCLIVKGTNEAAPRDRVQLARDRKLWREAEEMVKKLA